MALKIKVCYKDKNTKYKIVSHGDWIDIVSNQTFSFGAPRVSNGVVEFDTPKIDLGICMKLPKGFEAVVLPRSSMFPRYGLILSNSEGMIDNAYCGNNDTWKAQFIAFRAGKVSAGERILQFRIQPNQFATKADKLNWLLSNKVTIEEVQSMDSPDRGGFGSTGR